MASRAAISADLAGSAGRGGEGGGGAGVEATLGSAAAEGGGADGASAVTLIRQSLSPGTTLSPSGINNSSITPELGAGIGMAV